MKLLLIETEPGVAFPLEKQLRGEGHEVVQCNDEFGGPCRGVVDHRECPLHAHIDLAIVARSDQSLRTLNEMGAVCADQHRIPVAQVDLAETEVVLGDLNATAAVARRKVEADYVAAVRRELLQAGVEHDLEVDVARTPNRVAAVLHLPSRYSLPTQHAALADRARHAIRLHDPFVQVIDVSVVSAG